jgi:predicted 3-demethylubiquinone-9 3-methyltransferase (glyoxalase superfamily)
MASTARTKIFPHLWYAREAEEAARFYASIFPDSRVDPVREAGQTRRCSSGRERLHHQPG